MFSSLYKKKIFGLPWLIKGLFTNDVIVFRADLTELTQLAECVQITELAEFTEQTHAVIIMCLVSLKFQNYT